MASCHKNRTTQQSNILSWNGPCGLKMCSFSCLVLFSTASIKCLSDTYTERHAETFKVNHTRYSQVNKSPSSYQSVVQSGRKEVNKAVSTHVDKHVGRVNRKMSYSMSGSVNKVVTRGQVVSTQAAYVDHKVVRAHIKFLCLVEAVTVETQTQACTRHER